MRWFLQTIGLTGLLIAAPSVGFADEAPLTSADTQDAVAITVYSDGFGLVRDVRTVALGAGIARLHWNGVASRINTQSVSLVDLTDPNGIHILEQNYQYDLVDQQKLLQRYLGKQVEIRMRDDATGRDITKSATLLAPDVVEIDGKIYPGLPGQLILPALPEGLISTPTLEWLVDAHALAPQQLAMSYLTEGIGWRADYVAIINEGDTELDLNGWTTITNNSGATYENATLKLVAGTVNRERYPVQFDADGAEGLVFSILPKSQRVPGFEEKSFFEYHLYTLGRPATLKDHEQKQIALLDAMGVDTTKKYIFDPYGGYDWNNGNETQKADIRVILEFRNEKEQDLGIPLPEGIVRLYKSDADGTLQFIGEDSIEHTPKDEDITLHLGNAFDVVGERTVKARRKINKNTWEYDLEIRLRNHKGTPVTVQVLDHVSSGEWSVTTHLGGEYLKKDASTLEFNVPIAPDAEQVLTYTVRREY